MNELEKKVAEGIRIIEAGAAGIESDGSDWLEYDMLLAKSRHRCDGRA